VVACVYVTARLAWLQTLMEVLLMYVE